MVKVYGYKKCSTVMKSVKFLKENNQEVEFFDFVNEQISKETLEKIIKDSKQDIDLFFNSKGKVFKELELKDKLEMLSDDEKIDYLLSDGKLIKRPLIVFSDQVFIGFKQNEIDAYLGN
ncbi:MAG: Spx/MgsR family RNA polymerase-binding regulatory protein [Erysipelotrichales bacterium]